MSQTTITWTCNNCGRENTTTNEDPFCPGCGIRLATWATPKKLDYLRAVCKINDYDLVIDACAGSGMLQYPDGSIKPGSPLILEEAMRDKGEVVCIEVNNKTFKILERYATEAVLINDDCNKVIPEIIDSYKSTLVFIDPNGYGVPAIDRNRIIDLSRKPNIDQLIQYSWRIVREMGFCRRYLFCTDDDCPSDNCRQRGIKCDDCYNRNRALTWQKSLDTWWGPSDWLSWGSRTISEYASEYASPLRDNNRVETTLIEGKHKRNAYHLIFATKNELPRVGLRKWMAP